jgi:type I restriction enzyme R subunit
MSLRSFLKEDLRLGRDEKQTRIELINPILHERGWADALIREERTPGGTDIVDGVPRKRKGRTDYLLCIPVIDGKPPLAVAILEAKAEDKLPSLGIQQARDYMKKFNVPFVYSSNGHLYAEYADDTRVIRDAIPLSALPTPDDLKERYERSKNIRLETDNAKALFMPYKGGEAARYYFQDAAIRATLERLAGGSKKVLLSLATGTGKTIIAAQRGCDA